MTGRPQILGWRTITRDGATLQLHVAKRRLSLEWQLFLTGQPVSIARGTAILSRRVEDKAWKAFDEWIAGRSRWNGKPLCRDFTSKS